MCISREKKFVVKYKDIGNQVFGVNFIICILLDMGIV